MNWYKAELKGQEGYVPKTYIEMAPHPYVLVSANTQQQQHTEGHRHTSVEFAHYVLLLL